MRPSWGRCRQAPAPRLGVAGGSFPGRIRPEAARQGGGAKKPPRVAGRLFGGSQRGCSGRRAGATGGAPLPEPEAAEQQRQRRAGTGIRHRGTATTAAATAAATAESKLNRIHAKSDRLSYGCDAQDVEVCPREGHRAAQGGPDRIGVGKSQIWSSKTGEVAAEPQGVAARRGCRGGAGGAR